MTDRRFSRRLCRGNLRSAPPAITPDMVERVLAAVPARSAEPAPAPILTLVPKARPAKAAPSAAKATRGERAVRHATKAEAADRPEANVPTPPPVAAAAPISRTQFASPAGERIRSGQDEAKGSVEAVTRLCTDEAAPPRPETALPTRISASWIETYAARLNGARAFLRAKGHSVSRASETMGTWHVTGFGGTFSDTDLFELAEMQGFEA